MPPSGFPGDRRPDSKYNRAHYIKSVFEPNHPVSSSAFRAQLNIMASSAVIEKPADNSAARTVDKAPEGSTLQSTVDEPSASVRENGIDNNDPSKEVNSNTPAEVEGSLTPKEHETSEESQKPVASEPEQDVRSPTEEVTSSNEAASEQQNGDAPVPGNVRISNDAEISKPVEDKTVQKDPKKPAKRSSTMSTLAERLKPSVLIPRGRVTPKTAAPRGNHSSGGCVIY